MRPRPIIYIYNVLCKHLISQLAGASFCAVGKLKKEVSSLMWENSDFLDIVISQNKESFTYYVKYHRVRVWKHNNN